MATTQEEQIAALTDKLNALENESRRILRALNWSTKVRLILFSALLLFVIASSLMFYLLYRDIRVNRMAEVQRIIREKPEEFSEPLTGQIKLLAEEQGPHVIEVFRQQVSADSSQYAKSFDAERTILIGNLQKDLEAKLVQTYATMLDEQEAVLQEEFPTLKDQEKMENVRDNMEKVYAKIGKRYYVEHMKEELEEIVDRIDRFPSSDPKHDNIPIVEQIASEFLELVRMMLVTSETQDSSIAIPTELNRSNTGSANTNADSPDSKATDSAVAEPKSESTQPGTKENAGDSANSKKTDVDQPAELDDSTDSSSKESNDE